MKSLFRTILLSAVLAGPVAAQNDLAGTWQGMLEAAPGTRLAIQFVITAEERGGYSAVVTSPDSGAIKNVRAASVTFADGELTLDVPALSGGYAGTLRDGVLEGEWSQEGAKLPLSLRPLEAATLSAADIELLRGDWSGKLSAGGLLATIVLRFSTGDDGALRAALDVPEQGVRGWATESPTLANGRFAIRVPMARAEVTGQLEGDQIVGQWSQLGNSYPLTLKKGEYVAATTFLDLPAAARERLAGRWTGLLGPLTLTVRFEADAQGRSLGFMDIPQQNIVNAPMTAAALEGTKLTFTVAALGMSYTGELADDTITGQLSPAGAPNPVPLALKRE